MGKIGSETTDGRLYHGRKVPAAATRKRLSVFPGDTMAESPKARQYWALGGRIRMVKRGRAARLAAVGEHSPPRWDGEVELSATKS